MGSSICVTAMADFTSQEIVVLRERLIVIGSYFLIHAIASMVLTLGKWAGCVNGSLDGRALVELSIMAWRTV